jgi:hypothetical protein
MPRGLGWLAVCGPGVIVLGLSIGSGEFLLGPAVFVRYGLTLLWVSTVAILLQTIFNMEVMRYTLATGEPVFTGFMRTRPAPWFWAAFYTVLYLLQYGWPAFAGTAAGAIFFVAMRRMPEPDDAGAIYGIGVGLFFACAGVLSIGRRIVRTLEVLNWILVATTLGGFLLLAALFVPAGRWIEGLAGLVGFSPAAGAFALLPAGADLSLLAALVAYSGAGGVANLVLSNWARDKGYGMAAYSGYIASAIGGERVTVAHAGFTFDDSVEARRRWRGWWRIIRADQWGVFAAGAVLGMLLPAISLDPVQDAARQLRGDDARDYRHPVDRERRGAQGRARRRASGVLHRHGRARRLGGGGTEAGAALRAAPDQRQRRRRDLRRRVAPSVVSEHHAPAAARAAAALAARGAGGDGAVLRNVCGDVGWRPAGMTRAGITDGSGPPLVLSWPDHGPDVTGFGFLSSRR